MQGLALELRRRGKKVRKKKGHQRKTRHIFPTHTPSRNGGDVVRIAMLLLKLKYHCHTRHLNLLKESTHAHVHAMCNHLFQIK
jgi:hypothetical protein